MTDSRTPPPAAKFGTSINCMDGRVQLPVIEHLKSRYGLDYVDMVTEAGPVGILSEGGEGMTSESIRRRVEISVSKHGSALIAIVGHHDCAGNPVAEETQLEQIRMSIRTVESWGFDANIVGLWVDGDWSVREVT